MNILRIYPIRFLIVTGCPVTPYVLFLIYDLTPFCGIKFSIIYNLQMYVYIVNQSCLFLFFILGLLFFIFDQHSRTPTALFADYVQAQ